MMYVVFLLAAFTAALGSFSYYYTVPRIKPDAHLYFQDREDDKAPFQASRLLLPWKAYARKHFLEVFYDGKGRPSTVYRWQGGRRVETTYLVYDATGSLLSKTVKDVSGATKVFKYGS